MRSVLIFNLHKGIEQSMKLLSVCRKALKPLNLGDYKAYINDARETSIPASEKKSPIDAASPRLTPGVHAATTFQQALMDPPELQFVPSPGLSDESHNRAHVHEVIALNKAFNIFSGAYCLDILSSLILTIEAVDEIARCYSRLSLARVDNFHKARVEHKIARLDIIVAQAANQASVLKAMLGRI